MFLKSDGVKKKNYVLILKLTKEKKMHELIQIPLHFVINLSYIFHQKNLSYKIKCTRLLLSFYPKVNK